MFADDSGLEIDFLDKKPGIYSARWGGKNLDFNKAIKKVYRELNKKKDKNWKNKKIKARFVCALSLSYLKKQLYVFKELLKEKFQNNQLEKMVLVMIQYLFLIIIIIKLLQKFHQKKNINRPSISSFQKIKNFFNYPILNFV